MHTYTYDTYIPTNFFTYMHELKIIQYIPLPIYLFTCTNTYLLTYTHKYNRHTHTCVGLVLYLAKSGVVVCLGEGRGRYDCWLY